MGTRVGEVLASKYRLEELLGSGGMGHVYRAVNVEIERAVAIKVLRAEHTKNGPIVERFLREARAANLVRHPNVVDVVDVGRDGDGSPFIVQELLKGEDLSQFVERRGGKLTLAEVEAYLLPVIDAVAEAHAQGVVHRDIKPENVFLAEGPGKTLVPKLLDFGISKVRLPNIKVTEVGVMMGTPAYMSPEQIQGSSETDPRTDIWALGIMLFELLAGRLPFEADDAPQLFVAIATKDVPRLADVCPEVSAAVSLVAERCLRRLPDDRYPTALELARDLRHVLAGSDVEPTQVRLSAPAAHEPRPPRLDIPDLVLPGARGAIPAKAATTLSGRPEPLALSRTELTVGLPPVPPLPTPPSFAASSAPALGAAPSLHAAPPSAPTLAVTPPASRPQASPRASGLDTHASQTPHRGMSGIMLAGPSASAHRRSNLHPHPADIPLAPATLDAPLLIGLGVVGLTAIGVTALLMTFAFQPDGFQLVALVTTPTPTMNLIAHGGLAAVAVVLAGRTAVTGVKKWRGDIMGGHVSAVFSAMLAGALFFAALQLARAAW